MSKTVPPRPEGWTFAGAAGEYVVWHAGKNDYRITNGYWGDVVAHRTQFAEAHTVARHKHQERVLTSYYSDRANGTHAAKAP